jgi:hypothetical protein
MQISFPMPLIINFSLTGENIDLFALGKPVPKER